MAVQELESAFAVDGVGTVKEFDFCPIGNLHVRVVEASDLGKLIRHPFVGCHSVGMAALHHEWARSHQHGEFGVICDVGQIELDHVVFLRYQVAVTRFDTGVLPHPFIEIRRTDG